MVGLRRQQEGWSSGGESVTVDKGDRTEST